MDAFALGGIVVDSARAPEPYELHRSLADSFALTTPLHSHEIQTRAKQFAWLGEDADRAARFYANLNDLMAVASTPV